MKKTAIILSILVLSASVSAQTIVLGPIQTSFCSGERDTLHVAYQATGAFSNDNIFYVHVSDANGSFANYTQVGQSSSASGIIPVIYFGTGTRVIVTSLDPFVTSDTSEPVLIRPRSNPAIWAWRSANNDYYGNSQVGDPYNTSPYEGSNLTSPAAGVVGDTLLFTPPPFDVEAAQTVYMWKFPQDAVILNSYDSAATVVFPEPGYKTISLSVSSPTTCDGGSSWRIYVPSLHPTIPANARVITDTMGAIKGGPNDTVVWVKPGASFTSTVFNCTAFVEPGGTCDNSYGRLTYFRPDNGNFTWTRQPEIIIHDTTPGISRDTFYSPIFTFDYSKVEGAVAEVPATTLSLRQNGDHLLATADGSPIGVRISNLLGAEQFSTRGSGALDVDLSSLPAGVYFAIVQSGDERKVQRIAVVH